VLVQVQSAARIRSRLPEKSSLVYGYLYGQKRPFSGLSEGEARMPRTAGDFQLIERREEGRKTIYYVRFRGNDGELLPWRPTPGITSKTAARAWAQKEIKRGSVNSTRATFARYAEGWWTADHPYVQGRIARGHKLTATYLVVMRGHLENHVLPCFDDKRLAQITSRQIEDWILALRKKGLSPSTINHGLRCLKVMLKEATRHGIIARDPSAFITGLADHPVERGILTGAEIRKLFDEKSIGKVWTGDRMHYTMNLLAASTGMRMGEVQALSVRAVHENYVEVSQSWERRDGIKAGTKTGSGRLVPLPAYSARHLHELIASSPYQSFDDLVFYGQNRNTPITPRMILAGLYGGSRTDQDHPARARGTEYHVPLVETLPQHRVARCKGVRPSRAKSNRPPHSADDGAL